MPSMDDEQALSWEEAEAPGEEMTKVELATDIQARLDA
jgi:hypothetical protein